MELVYATGQREREFGIASGRAEVPAGARVYATCTAEGTVEEVGEHTFKTMSDEEYYALKAQVREARARAAAATADGAPRGLLARLFGR